MTKQPAKKKTRKPETSEHEKPALTFTTPNREGRPTKYKPEYCEQIIAFMQEGGRFFHKPMVVDKEIIDHPLGRLPALFENFAEQIGVCTSTLAKWREDYPEFSEAYKKAKEIQLSHMVSGLVSGTYSTAGCIFALKNMHRWADKMQISGPEGGPIQHQDSSKTLEWISKLSPEAQEEIKNAALAE